MQDYDSALKLLLRDAQGHAMEYLTGHKMKKWLNTDLPHAPALRADLVCAGWDDSTSGGCSVDCSPDCRIGVGAGRVDGALGDVGRSA